MWIRAFGATLLLGMALACGGGGGAGGYSVGPYATTLAEYYETEVGKPCPTYRIGDEVDLGDFSIRVDKVLLAEPENSLPWISNSTERKDFSKDGVKALIIEYAWRNNTPLKAKREHYTRIKTTDGEKGWWQPYNKKLYNKEHGIEDFPSQYPPNQWVKGAGTLSVNGEYTDGATMYVTHETEEYDPTDPRGRRKIDVIHQHALIDLATPEPAPHINPEKR